MSYSPYIQVSNLQRAPGSLILHHSYIHSCCSVKFSARSAHSQAREKHPCLWMAVCRDELSYVKLHPPDRSLPEKLKQRARSQQVEREPSRPFMHLVSMKMQVQNYTFNINFEMTTSKGKQLPTATSLLYRFFLGGEGSSWKKANTSFSSVSQKECEVNHRLFPSKFVVSY